MSRGGALGYYAAHRRLARQEVGRPAALIMDIAEGAGIRSAEYPTLLPAVGAMPP